MPVIHVCSVPQQDVMIDLSRGRAYRYSKTASGWHLKMKRKLRLKLLFFAIVLYIRLKQILEQEEM